MEFLGLGENTESWPNLKKKYIQDPQNAMGTASFPQDMGS